MPPERKEKKETPPVSDTGMPSSQSQTPLQQARSGSVGQGGGNLVSQGKKLGLQPMADTNDGLMKMSIE